MTDPTLRDATLRAAPQGEVAQINCRIAAITISAPAAISALPAEMT